MSAPLSALRVALAALYRECVSAGHGTDRDFGWPKVMADAKAALESNADETESPQQHSYTIPPPRGFVLTMQCAGCGVRDAEDARHFSGCPAYPGELVRPAVKTSAPPTEREFWCQCGKPRAECDKTRHEA